MSSGLACVIICKNTHKNNIEIRLTYSRTFRTIFLFKSQKLIFKCYSTFSNINNICFICKLELTWNHFGDLSILSSLVIAFIRRASFLCLLLECKCVLFQAKIEQTMLVNFHALRCNHLYMLIILINNILPEILSGKKLISSQKTSFLLKYHLI